MEGDEDAKRLLVGMPLKKEGLRAPEWKEFTKETVSFGGCLPEELERRRDLRANLMLQREELASAMLQGLTAICGEQEMEDAPQGRAMRKIKSICHPDSCLMREAASGEEKGGWRKILQGVFQDASDACDAGRVEVVEGLVEALRRGSREGKGKELGWKKTEELYLQAEQEFEQEEKEWIEGGRWKEALRLAKGKRNSKKTLTSASGLALEEEGEL